ncbi:hypothetical protein VT03_19495 [Planctomyces sp. SH-PL14]|nr:hypothetical protein VT03_19495 [Planctomyces sp. SH-PL14]
MRNRGQQRTSLCGTGVEDSTLALESPRVGEGASHTSSAFGHTRYPMVFDETASGGQRAEKTTQAPLHSLTRVPLDPDRDK